MASGLKVLREMRVGKGLLRALGGDLDDLFDPTVVGASGATTLVLDLERVAHVTSFGVREWIRATNNLRKRIEGLYYVRVSPRLTDQFNMVVGFDGGGSLLTFRAFYSCPTCGEESEAAFDAQLDRESFEALRAPVRQCRVCGRDAELDDDPAVLFEYMRASKFVPPPADVMAVMRHPDSWLDELPGIRLSVRAAVVEQQTVYRMAGVLDNSLPVRRIADSASARTQLSLTRLAHVEANALDRWRALLSEITSHGTLALSGVPPVMLRRAVDDPSVLGGVEIESVVFPMRCKECRVTQWPTIPVKGNESWFKTTVPCKNCQKPLSHVCPANDLLAFQQAVQDRPTQAVAPQSGATRPPHRVNPAPPPAEDARAAPLETFEEKFEVLCKIGQGGMADVFLARQIGAMGFKRLVVIKKVKKQLVTDDRMIRLFLDEARLASLIDHHNVVRVHDLGRADETFYMVMDFVHGRSITEGQRELKRRNKTVPVDVAVAIAADTCAGLSRAHAPDTSGRTLVHRDVTPNNILVSFSGVVKLTDFGLAGYHHFEKDELRQNHILGNIPFVPPEVYLGKQAVPQSDLWGVGITLYVMLTGENPFQKETTDETASAIVHQKLKWPWRTMPRKVFKVLKKAMAKDPKDRYASAQDMERDLRAIAGRTGQTEIAAWMRTVFGEQLRIEHEFMNRTKTQSLSEALLSSVPNDVARFFRVLRAHTDTGVAPEEPREQATRATPIGPGENTKS